MAYQWYAYYPGDYARDTAHLTMQQDGGYHRLLNHYYATGRPLPLNKATIYRIARAMEDSERSAVDFVLEQFFELREGGYHNPRADKELTKRAASKLSLSERGRRGAAKRWRKPSTDGIGHSSAIGRAEGQWMQEPQPHPHQQPQQGKKHPAPSAPSMAADLTHASIEQGNRIPAFEVFWEKWPRKQAKQSARRAWMKIPIGEYSAIVSGLEKWRTSDQWTRGVIPHPSTWLNEKRWQDEDIPQCGGSNVHGKPNGNSRPSAAIHAEPGKYEHRTNKITAPV